MGVVTENWESYNSLRLRPSRPSLSQSLSSKRLRSGISSPPSINACIFRASRLVPSLQLSPLDAATRPKRPFHHLHRAFANMVVSVPRRIESILIQGHLLLLTLMSKHTSGICGPLQHFSHHSLPAIVNHTRTVWPSSLTPLWSSMT
jgi:hypothetical protein